MTAILAAPFINGFLPHFASRALSRRKTRRVYDASSVCQITTVPIITRRRNVVELVSYLLAQCNVTVTSDVYRVSLKMSTDEGNTIALALPVADKILSDFCHSSIIK